MIGKEILNYVVTSYIGQGGMGSVYLAENKYIKSQKVAIKVINSSMVNAFTKAQLAEEAEHLSKLDHPNIVHFLNYHIDEAGNIYLIMQYADGMSLEKYINTVSGLIVEERICQFFEPILDAVGYAHKRNIMHRDLKPNNIMIGTDGTPRILDFGIAKIITNEDGTEANDGLIMGTPSFMSPEQVKGEALDARSDIYSLGVMLHQMLTGRAPYDTTTMSEHEINQKVVEEPLPRMKTYYSYVSDKLQKIVDKATAKDPKDRYSSCEEFKKALHDAVYPPKMPKWVRYAAMVIGLIIFGSGIYWWDYTRTKVYYYKDYVEQWGVPQGIGEVSSSQKSHMSRVYKFEYERRKLIRVSHVNSLDKIINDSESERSERPTDMMLYYTPEGKVSRVLVKDKAGKVEYVKSYNSSLETMIFQYDDNHGTEKTLGKSTIGVSNAMNASDTDDKGRISRWLLEYDSDGYVSKVTYAGFQNVVVGDADNIYGRMYERDEKGRIVTVTYLGRNGQPKGTKWGLGKKTFEYDRNDNFIRVCYLTIDDKPAYDKVDGINIYELEYDENGNQIFELHEDSEGRLMISKAWGAAGEQREYDSKGMKIKEITLGTDRQPCYRNEGFAIAQMEYDEFGFLSKSTCYDLEGNICLNSIGFASISIKNDSVGNWLELWMYDVDGSLTLDDDNKAGVKSEFDSIGNLIRYTMFGIDQLPVIGKHGYCGYTQTYNHLGAIKQVVFFGKDMNPIMGYDGIMSIVYDYDERGNQIRQSYTDETGHNLICDENGFACIEDKYDENGNTIRRSYFDDKGKPAVHSDGNASWEATYDENGNRTSFTYLDKDGKLVAVEGRAGSKYKCDDRGNVIESYSIGTDGDILKDSYIGKYKYDDHDNQIEYAVFDKSGKKVLGYSGYHCNVTKYDNRNQIVEELYYDTSGNLKNWKNGFAIAKYEYDDRGNRIRRSYYGPDRTMVKTKDGYAMSIYEYDNMNRVTKMSFFGKEGTPADVKDISPVVINKYDKWGNTIFWGFEDGHGSYIIDSKWGCAIKRKEYDIRGNLLMDACFNEKDNAFVSKQTGCHKAILTYDNRGNVITEAFFDEFSSPMVNKLDDYGYHKVEYAYNSKNLRSEVKYYGTDGLPMLKDGYHKSTTTYVASGKLDEVKYFGKNGEAVNSIYGYHRTEYTYTESGENDKAICYSASGAKVNTYKWDGNTYQLVRSWQSMVENQSTPVYTGEDWGYLVLKSMYVTGSNSFRMVVTTPKSKYDMSDEMLKAYKEVAVAMAKVFVDDETFKRSRVYCSLVMYDSSNRELYNTNVY